MTGPRYHFRSRRIPPFPPIGTVLVDGQGRRSRVVGMQPSVVCPDMPVYAKVTVEPIDWLAGWVTSPRAETWSFGHLSGQVADVLGPDEPEPEGHRELLEGRELSTAEWFTVHVEPQVAPAERAAVRAVWLGSAAGP